MTRQISIKGFQFKDGRLVRDEKAYSVSVQLKRKASKKLKVKRGRAK